MAGLLADSGVVDVENFLVIVFGYVVSFEFVEDRNTNHVEQDILCWGLQQW